MRPPRLAGFSYVGCYQYFLTICAFERRLHFTTAGLVEDVKTTFLRTADEEKFAILAYCFMPDHVHLLAEGENSSSDLRSFVATAKQRAAHEARRWIHGRMWQSGFFDRILREEDGAQDIARYIVQNPLRARLVQSVLDYPFWGSARWSREDLVESTMWRPGAP